MQPSNFSKLNRLRLACTPVTLAFFGAIFITGLISAFRTPTLTIYLHNEVTNDPMMIGLFYSINSFGAMVLSQIVAYYSDRYLNRIKVIAFSCIMQMFGCLLFALNRDYYLLLIIGTLLFGLGASASAQIFSLAREYSKVQQYDSSMFNTVLRAQFSLSWVIGPPLAYFIADEFGFTFMYAVSATMFIVTIALVYSLLPQAGSSSIKSAHTTLSSHEETDNKTSIFFLSITSLLLAMCNAMMFINMPIYLSNVLGLPERLAGTMMGVAAGIEIPVMLIAGYCTRFLSKKTLMVISLLAGTAYYLGLYFSTSETQLITIQLFNGIHIGIFVSIGMLYFQDLMPNKLGSATTLFANSRSASWIIAGPIAGVMASQFGYQSTWWLTAILCTLALFFMAFVRKI